MDMLQRLISCRIIIIIIITKSTTVWDCQQQAIGCLLSTVVGDSMHSESINSHITFNNLCKQVKNSTVYIQSFPTTVPDTLVNNLQVKKCRILHDNEAYVHTCMLRYTCSRCEVMVCSRSANNRSENCLQTHL